MQTYSIDTPYLCEYTQSTHPINIPYPHTLSMHYEHCNLHYQQALTPYQRTYDTLLVLSSTFLSPHINACITYYPHKNTLHFQPSHIFSFARLTLSIAYMFMSSRSMSHVPPSLPFSLSLPFPLPPYDRSNHPSINLPVYRICFVLSMLGSGGSMQGMLGIPNQGTIIVIFPRTLSTHPINPPSYPPSYQPTLLTHPIIMLGIPNQVNIVIFSFYIIVLHRYILSYNISTHITHPFILYTPCPLLYHPPPPSICRVLSCMNRLHGSK